MRTMLGIMFIVTLAIPAAAGTGEADSGQQMVLAYADTSAMLDAIPKKARIQLEKSSAEVKVMSPVFKSYLKGGDKSSSSKVADLYTSPGGLVCINPFFKSGAKGLFAKVRW